MLWPSVGPPHLVTPPCPRRGPSPPLSGPLCAHTPAGPGQRCHLRSFVPRPSPTPAWHPCHASHTLPTSCRTHQAGHGWARPGVLTLCVSVLTAGGPPASPAGASEEPEGVWLGDLSACASQPQAPPWLGPQGQEGQDCRGAVPSLPDLSCATLTLWAPREPVRGRLPTPLGPSAGSSWLGAGTLVSSPSSKDLQVSLLLSPVTELPIKDSVRCGVSEAIGGAALYPHMGSVTVTLDTESQGPGGCLWAALWRVRGCPPACLGA